jgi:hypothetical protein
VIKQQFIDSLNDSEVTSIASFCDKYCEQIFFDFQSVCWDKATSHYVPQSLNALNTSIFSGDCMASRGFFIFRADSEVKDYKLPRFRFHQFFKYVEGLWGELTSSRQHNQQQVIENVFFSSHELVRRNGIQHKVLELLRCECCGELFIGGNRHKIDADNYYLTLNYPELEKIPNRNPTPMVQNKDILRISYFGHTRKMFI